jgi:hypothetical protein
MAVLDEIVLLRRTCARNECLAIFFLCRSCNRGHRYCSRACSRETRLRQRRCANRRYQQSTEGRDDHRDRQRAYRQRRGQARVTDQGPIRSLPRHYLHVGRWKRAQQQFRTNPAYLHCLAFHRFNSVCACVAKSVAAWVVSSIRFPRFHDEGELTL